MTLLLFSVLKLVEYNSPLNDNSSVGATEDYGAMKKIITNYRTPYLGLFAKRHIRIRKQLLYDYGVGQLPSLR